MRLPVAAVALLALATAAPALAAVTFEDPRGPGFVTASPAEAAFLMSFIPGIMGATEMVNKNLTQVPAAAAAAAASSAPPPILPAGTAAKALGSYLAAAVAQADALSTLGDPSVFKYPMDNRVALYRLPRTKAVRGTCIFIHGCKHDPYSWFYKSRKCPLCTGLPEEVSHSKQCLARGYAVLALMSKNREYRNRCFASSGGPTKNDQGDAGVVVKAWLKRFGLSRKPKFIFGISSGASFAIKFPKTMYVDGVISEVNMPWEKAWGMTDANSRFVVKFPPTAFYEMARDPQTSQQIAAALRIFKKNGVPAEAVKVPIRRVTARFLSDRSIYISLNQAKSIRGALLKIGMIDARGNIRYDPRKDFPRTNWTAKLAKVLPWLNRNSPYYNLISDESQIWQALNLAYSQHEIVSDYVRPTLIWLERGGRGATLNNLVKRFDLYGRISCLNERTEGCRK